jgi:hypothetical protein
MELALNLLWLCVAIVGVMLQFVALSRAATPSSQPPNAWRKILAMGCTLVILFFVISMTDDLHSQEIVVEESKFSRIAPGTSASSHSAPGRVVPVVFLLNLAAASLAPALPAVRRLVEPPIFSFAAAIICDRLCGRAPPVPPA